MSINESGIVLGQYKGLKAEKPEVSVEEEEIRASYEKRRKELAVIQDVAGRGIEQGDIAYIDYNAACMGRAFDGSYASDFPVEIGPDEFLPGFSEQLEVLEPGDKINVTVTLPKNYKDPSVAGKEATFKCQIKQIKKPVYPEYEEVRDRLLEDIKEEKHQEADSQMEDRLLEAIVAGSQIPVDETVLEEETKREFDRWAETIEAKGFIPVKYLKVFGSDEETQMEVLKPKAEFRIKSALALEAIAQAEGLTASQEEVDEQIAMIAAHFKMPPEELKQRFDEAALESVRSDVLSYKAMELIKENAVWE